MKLAIQVFQDEADVKNGFLQLSICEGTHSCCVYFTLVQWQEFKDAVNRVEKAANHEDMATSLESDNPLQALYRDAAAIELMFGGFLTFEMYFPKSDVKLWRCFKKAVNDFVVETPKQEAP